VSWEEPVQQCIFPDHRPGGGGDTDNDDRSIAAVRTVAATRMDRTMVAAPMGRYGRWRLIDGSDMDGRGDMDGGN